MTLEVEDRVLAHLETCIGAKLRRRESFYFSWVKDVSVGSGRVTLWVHPQTSLVFTYDGSRRPELNRTWLEMLMQSANSSKGLTVMPEPDDVISSKLSVAVGAN